MNFKGRRRHLVAALLALLAAHMPALSASAANDKTTAEPPKSLPAGEDVPAAYERRLLRLAEVLGALAYLQDLCKDPNAPNAAQVWRAQMTALMDAEGKTPLRRERLAGSYNRGFRGYETSYRHCTVNAQTIITRFLDESGRLAHEIAQHAGPT